MVSFPSSSYPFNRFDAALLQIQSTRPAVLSFNRRWPCPFCCRRYCYCFCSYVLGKFSPTNRDPIKFANFSSWHYEFSQRSMDTEDAMNQPDQVGNLFPESMNELEQNFIIQKAKYNITELSRPSTATDEEAASLWPITPDSQKETGDFLFDLSSPLTLVSSSKKFVCFDSPPNDSSASVNGSPSTPKEGVFDPFAPGPDELMLAPRCKKFMEDSCSKVSRRLDFDSSIKFSLDGNYETDAETMPGDEILLETMYGTLLEAIVTKQTEGLLAGILPQDPGTDGLKTPNFAIRLSGIAETCPGAPRKGTRKLRNISQSLCRKLEF